MEIYDKYLFDDLVQCYNQNNLSKDEYESILQCFKILMSIQKLNFICTQ